jgi:signal transduction histidine kinase/ActR/RegA family two-component response regulator
MSLRATFLLIAAALIALLAGILGAMSLLVGNQRALAAAEARRYDSYKLADELRQSSDDLTRMARTYVVTGEARFEEWFRRILAIRNGEAPRPENYGGIYWDFVTASGEKPTPDGPPVALESLMREMRFSEAEFAKLREAQAESDALVALEDRAMAAVKGLFPDAEGRYTLRGEPDLPLARRLMHGAEYHRAKAQIMAPIGEFLTLVEQRTKSEMAALRARGSRLGLATLGLMGLAAAVVLLGVAVLQRRVARPVLELAAAARRAEGGDYAGRVQPRGGDEIGLLARAFNQMAAAIERDVGERRRHAEELARAREAAEAANRAKSAFLANMSHELRTPMNAVIGYSEMLEEELQEAGHEQYLADLRKVHAAGKHLLALINDVLDLSKIESGRMDLHLERFDLRAQLEEALATVRPLVEANGNTLAASLEGDLGAMHADLTKLRQALFNLLSNAAKFTRGGSVTLEARREARAGGDWIALCVRDTGIGIPADKLEHIFDEFTQAEEHTARDFGGTGLGLAISRRFCRMMGGDVTVQSRPGQGSSFTIELPASVGPLEAARAAPAAGALPAAQPRAALSAAPGRAVLVIDDDATARDLLRRTLAGDGFAVAEATTGAEGLRLARELRPAVISLDVMMPDMDGWAVLRQLKADPELAQIPVVMVSILPEKGLGFALGASEYLTKPLDRNVLLQLVRRYAGGDAPEPGSGS